MKKQFFRVKQLADQTFLRADKTEALNQDELKKADLKVEYIQKALTEIAKKLPTTTVPSQESAEKRLKKFEEYGIAQAMLYQLQNEGDFSKDNMLLQFVLKECGNAEKMLASVKMEHESEMSEHVSAPINSILEKELPNVAKQKKNLNKHILDKDSAKNRYQSAKKVGTVKENNLKEDMDEADIKLDQSRDCLATEMFGLLRREKEVCSYFLQFLKLQRSYHENAYKYLQEVIPKLEKTIGEDKNSPVFGCPLSEYLEASNLRIAFPLELCAFALMELGGMSEEGLFRVTGSAARVKRLRLSIDCGCFTLPLIPEYRDVHVLASTLKLYLRELPEPLLTYKLHDEWMDCINHNEENRISVVQETLKKLPAANFENLAFLMQFLCKLTKHPENRMTPSNIAIVISPNLLWTDAKEEHINMKNCAALNMIVELFINQMDLFFPNDMLKLIKLKSADLSEVDDFVRPDINCLRHSVLLEQADDAASPKPNMRFKKAKPAPAPPVQQQQQQPQQQQVKIDNVTDNYYYSASGTASLNRPAKLRPDRPAAVTKKEDDFRRRSLADDGNKGHLNNSSASLVNAQNAAVTTDDDKVESVTAQIMDNKDGSRESKPVAAPRTTIPAEKQHIQREKEESMSKSLSCIDVECTDVTEASIRRKAGDYEERTHGKPAIPMRPASLRNPRTGDCEANIVRCYNIPQKTNTVHHNRNNHNYAAGHDNQMAEKEKFLGHLSYQSTTALQTVENKCGDINSNNNSCNSDISSSSNKPEVPNKPPFMKSNERLDTTDDSVEQQQQQQLLQSNQERFNGNAAAGNKPSHARTRSDGNIVDVKYDGVSLLQAPPSPRSLNKPSQPPPPPPTAVAKTKNPATDEDISNL